jgi:ABC-type cobalt transport system substrate-binding protein
MLLDRFPFWYRAAFLAGLMIVAAGVELLRSGKSATRYKEYAFIWLTALLGCIIGAATDLITSSISPEYFTWGKGVLEGEGFQTRIILFGLKQGISAGVIAGAICIYASRRKSKFPPLPFRALLSLLWIPTVGAVVCAFLLPLLAGHSDPAHLAAQLNGNLSATQSASFLRVWWIHTGLYAGLLLGLVFLLTLVARRRRATPGNIATA